MSGIPFLEPEAEGGSESEIKITLTLETRARAGRQILIRGGSFAGKMQNGILWNTGCVFKYKFRPTKTLAKTFGSCFQFQFQI